MRPQVRLFRNTAATACQQQGFSFREFMEGRGLEDILNEAEEKNWPAKEIAGQVLFRCCITNGKFNNFQVGFLAVMTFLNKHFGTLGQGQEQAFKDLAKTLNNPGNLQGVRAWLNTHYH